MNFYLFVLSNQLVLVLLDSKSSDLFDLSVIVLLNIGLFYCVLELNSILFYFYFE